MLFESNIRSFGNRKLLTIGFQINTDLFGQEKKLDVFNTKRASEFKEFYDEPTTNKLMRIDQKSVRQVEGRDRFAKTNMA
jgi:hypothetical protein